jgi:hypothetical protein
MQKYKTIEELSEYLDNTNLRVMKREWNIVHFNNWFRAEVEFEKEYFI